MWWHNAVIYQVYPRSLQDSDGDGVGDLRGILARLDHVVRLGADAVWLSPIYPSPLADFGYDVSDYVSVDPQLGTLSDFDALLAGAHARGLRLLMDLVPCHTSIEHPWFREHPERYIWADGGPPNNWVATFGGPAWTRDEVSGRWYLHSFYPEQPDLNWRNPEVVSAMQAVIRFWLERGVDGFRLDALDRLLKDRELRDDPSATKQFPLPLHTDFARLEHLHSSNDPEIGTALSSLRAAIGDRLMIGEVFLPTAQLGPYLEHLDTAFCFELLYAPNTADALRAIIEAALAAGRASWVISNHDFSRLVSRVGRSRARVFSTLLLTLPGPVFLYQGDEIGMADGTAPDPPLDRAGRDGLRTPMQWTPAPDGGFSAGSPWLAPENPQSCNVVDQEADSASMLWLYRRLIALRRNFGPELRFLDTAETVLAYERGEYVVALNLGEESAPAPAAGELLLSTHNESPPREQMPPHSGRIARRTG